MGNLNCCSSSPNQTELGNQDPQVETFQGTANPDTNHGKVQAQVQEENEQKQEQVESSVQSQNTYVPSKSIAEGIKKRIAAFQPALNASLKQIEELILLVAQIYDPSEQVILLKQAILTIGNNLSNLNLYWIAVHETETHQETPAFLESLEKELLKIKEFLTGLKVQASEQIQKAATTETKSEHDLFKEILQLPVNIAILEKDVKELNVKRNQFQLFTSVRQFFENKFLANQSGIQIQNVEQELTSYLPAYIRKEFASQTGFSLWNQLFRSSVDVCVDTFSKLYADKCGLEAKQIQFIVRQINSGMNTISFFEFMHFIKDNANSSFFDAQGLILKDKHEEVQKLAEQEHKKVEPKQESEGKYTFQNGAVYEGQLVEGFRSGQGKFTQFDIHYEGNFKNGLYDGEGTQTFPDETKYVGSFLNGQYHGQGELTTYNGIVYAGEWNEGVLKTGTITFTNGLTYKGDVLYNRFRQGKGTLTNELKQEIFNGEFVFDELFKGQFKINNQLLLEGEFNQSKTTEGTLHYIDAQYKGQLNSVTLCREGKGTMTWQGKQELSGNWVNDAPTVAKNIFDTHAEKQSYYDGEWKNFNRHGKGTFFYQSGAVYKGDVNMNIRQGKGIYTFANKNQYEGDWQNNDFNGQGVFTFQNQDVYTGSFKNGKYDGFGYYKYSNGKSYKGEWKEEKWHGQGIYYDAQGKINKQGQWEADKFKTQANVDIEALEKKYQAEQQTTQQVQPVQQQQAQPVQQQQATQEATKEVQPAQQQQTNQEAQPAQQQQATQESKPVVQEQNQQQAQQNPEVVEQPKQEKQQENVQQQPQAEAK